MRRFAPLTALVVVLAGVVATVLVVAPERIEAGLNQKLEVDLPEPSEAARALHERLWIADLHDDLLLWGRDPLVRSSRGHTDVPRLVDARVALQVLGAVTKTPSGLNFESNSADAFDMITALAIVQRWPPATWWSLRERALYIGRRFQALGPRSVGAVTPVRTGMDVDAAFYARRKGARGMGVMLSAEGLHMLEGRLETLEELWDHGYRMLAPTHFFDNEVAGSAHGEEKGGLTPFGVRVVDRMQEIGFVIDLAHASPATIDDVLARAKSPVIVSHTGVQATCPGPRNLSDAHLRAIAATGGLVGIGFFEGAVCDPSPDGIARAIRHAADVVGVEHVALGSDWDGATSVVVGPGELVYVTDALLRAGFSEAEVRGVMGRNAQRVLRAALPQAAPGAPAGEPGRS